MPSGRTAERERQWILANAPELLAQKDIDGGLIGGAIVESRSFVELITTAAAVN